MHWDIGFGHYQPKRRRQLNCLLRYNRPSVQSPRALGRSENQLRRRLAVDSAAANWPRIAGVIGARNLTSRSGANARPPACVAHVNPPLTFPWPHNIVSRWSPKSMAGGLATPRVLPRFLPATICGLLCRRKPPEVRSHHRFAFSFDAHALSQPATSPG
jgi:hypothetical protein